MSSGHAVMPSARRNCLEIAITPSAVRVARRWTAGQLAADPSVSGDLVDAAVLAVSELVTNAIQAALGAPAPCAFRFGSVPGRPARPSGEVSLAGPRVALVVARLDQAVRIEVHDSCGAALPPVHCRDENAESGRGLTVVSSLADDWGCQPGAMGKVVWCELTDAGCSLR